MKTDINDPWRTVGVPTTAVSSDCDCRFEDSFVEDQSSFAKLDDSEEYLEKLYSRLRFLQKGNSKKDLIKSLSVAKEDCIARYITSNQKSFTEEEAYLDANPLMRHIAPHLQALTATELVHLLKADVLQAVTNEQQKESSESTTEQQAKNSAEN